MTPTQEIQRLYREYPQPATFRQDIMAYAVFGYVIARPDLFVMGRPVCRDADPDDIATPWVHFDKPDSWLIYAFSGSSRNMLDFIPYPLQWIGFQRRGNPLKFNDYNRFLQLLRK
jgi:hypothetical protein